MADAEKGQEIDLDDAEALGEDEIDERITCSVSHLTYAGSVPQACCWPNSELLMV